jgi:hypothetical protein
MNEASPRPVNLLSRPPGAGLRVALSGTSNSLFVHGLSTGFSHDARVATFVNRSLGASGTVAVACHLQDLDLTDFDFLFIEYCVNETYFLEVGMGEAAHTRRNLANLIDHAAAQGCIPVLVVFLSLPAHATGSGMMEVIDHLVDLGVPCFDATAVVAELAEAWRVPLDSFFHDPLHLARPVARAIGRVILDRLEAARSAGAIAERTSETVESFGDLTFLDASEAAPQAEAVERRTSLLETRLVRIRPGFPARFAGLHRPATIVGVAFNAARSGGDLVTTDGRMLMKEFRTNLTWGARDFVQVVYPVSTAVEIGEGPFEIAVTETTAEPRPGEEPGFELQGLVLHPSGSERRMRVVAVDVAHRRLHDGLGRIERHILRRAHEAAQTQREAAAGRAAATRPPGDPLEA